MARLKLACLCPRISLFALLVGVAAAGAAAGLGGRIWLARRAQSALGRVGASVHTRDEGFGAPREGGLICAWDGGRPSDLKTLAAALRDTPKIDFLYIFPTYPSPEPLNFCELDVVPRLTGLSVNECRGVATLEKAEFLKRLEFLKVVGTAECSGAMCGTFSQCPALRHLDLSATCADDDGLKKLPPGLKTLRIRDTQMTASLFMDLNRFTALETLDISRGNWLTDLWGREREPHSMWPGGLAGFFPEFHRVDSQQLDPSVRNHVAVSGAAFPTTLRWLDVSGWNLSNEVLEQVARLPNLEYINLSGQTIDGDCFNQLVENSKLRAVGFSDCTLPADFMARLVACRQIESLDLRGHPVDPGKLRTLAEIAGLRRVYVDVRAKGHRAALDDVSKLLDAFRGRKLFLECPQMLTLNEIKKLAANYGQDAFEIH